MDKTSNQNAPITESSYEQNIHNLKKTSRPNPSLLAKLSALAYETSYTSEEDKNKFQNKLKSLGLVLVGEPIHNIENKAHAYLCTNGRFRVLCFRGTEKNRSHILDDLGMEALAKTPTKPEDKIHIAFLRPYKAIENNIFHLLKETRTKGLLLYITGYSTGGALATVAAIKLGATGFKACYTFGAPACAEPEMVQTIHRKLNRFVNIGDIIPQLLSLTPNEIPPMERILWGLEHIYEGSTFEPDVIRLGELFKIATPGIGRYKYANKPLTIFPDGTKKGTHNPRIH